MERRKGAEMMDMDKLWIIVSTVAAGAAGAAIAVGMMVLAAALAGLGS